MKLSDNRPLEEILHSYFSVGFPLSEDAYRALELSTPAGPDESGSPRANTRTFRKIAAAFNNVRQVRLRGSEPIFAGQLASLSILTDVLRYVLTLYTRQQVPESLPSGIAFSNDRSGPDSVTTTSLVFARLFPPPDVLVGDESPSEYLANDSDEEPNLRRAVREIMLLSLALENPALERFRGLYDDAQLRRQSAYGIVTRDLEEFFDEQPAFEPLRERLFDCLRAPMRDSPESLEGQLEYIGRQWAAFLPPDLLRLVMLARDILREETRIREAGPGDPSVLEFVSQDYLGERGHPEAARFSRDADWMSNVVIIAKSTFVWLDQLSSKYGRHIKYLNEIPNEELDQLAHWGFTGLWLIGLWKRSSASRRIKRTTGNPEAISSAYSLYDYAIADDLGGEDAYQDLKRRAEDRGIRLASDMVPNHTGVFSRWVIEHPDWYVQTQYPPFPAYNYAGQDLSEDDRTCIQIEDGYWDRRDAAVVFKRTDKWTGETRYIYHGNDGTNMPWNDTAQLDFLKPEVREAVIQTILHVARKFSIIRFDAAMTLAKKHYQRLWYPMPGDAGAVPSRAERGMSREEFEKMFPEEFWRQVVDRVAREVPDTLLLAEAFWLMEGYFVRTLGMHRVYNSAFMNMLKLEDNCKYRMTVKNVLEFSPEILKRFVNFMNNPDEATAVAQFGNGDKYFGVAVMMVTMPGLPMFGHGQIEGLTEKYGMEYSRAYWDEQPDEQMVRRHEREIFPLMRRRKLFSGSENFAFFDFTVPGGHVDENVFAYSNKSGEDCAVIIYNNAYGTTTGHINMSTAINVSTGADQHLVRKSLAEALTIDTDDSVFYCFRDHRTGSEYLQSGRQIGERGLSAELMGYQYCAYLDFRRLVDHDGSLGTLCDRLNGGGISSVEKALRKITLEPALDAFRYLMRLSMASVMDGEEPRRELVVAVNEYIQAIAAYAGTGIDTSAVADHLVRELIRHEQSLVGQSRASFVNGQSSMDRSIADEIRGVAIAWTVTGALGMLSGEVLEVDVPVIRSRISEWFFFEAIRQAFEAYGWPGDATSDAQLVSVMHSEYGPRSLNRAAELVRRVEQSIADEEAAEYLQLNTHEGAVYFNKQRLERLLAAYLCAIRVHLKFSSDADEIELSRLASEIERAAAQAEYKVDRFLAALSAIRA